MRQGHVKDDPNNRTGTEQTVILSLVNNGLLCILKTMVAYKVIYFN